MTTKFLSSPVSSCVARLVARPTVSAFLFCRGSTAASRVKTSITTRPYFVFPRVFWLKSMRSEKQPATEFRVLQDNADRFQHNKDLTNRRIKAVEDAGAFRAPTNAARSFNPQYGDVQQPRAVDSMTVRSTKGRETLLKLALPAPQGSGNAAGRLTRRGRPAAVRQLDDFLAPPRRRTLD